jgi:dipeptidyl aminopeptidase/acylaminoacyl peptidase
LPSYIAKPAQLPSQDGASVNVLSSGSGEEIAKTADRSAAAVFGANLADLAVVNVGDGSPRILVSNRVIRGYRLSPDRKSLAYTEVSAVPANTERYSLALRVINFASGRERLLADDLSLEYGHEFEWSPDGSMVALSSLDPDRIRRLKVLYLDGKKETSLSAAGTDAGQSKPERDFAADCPIWKSDSLGMYAIIGGRIAVVDLKRNQIAIGPSSIFGAVTRLVGMNNGHIVGITVSDKTGASTLVQFDKLGNAEKSLWRPRSRHITPDGAAFDDSGALLFFSEDVSHPSDVWRMRHGRSPQQITTLNPELSTASPDPIKRITWRAEDGTALSGVLLMPKAERDGVRFPVVVMAYAGVRTEASSTMFGAGWGSMPAFNFQVLRSRGYGIFLPDLPVKTGTVIDDIVSDLRPAINALATQSMADSSRLAIMGQSYGSYTVWSVLTRMSIFRAAITSGNIINPDLTVDYLQPDAEGGKSGSSGYYEDGQGNMGGTPWDFPERYRANSPIFSFNKIRTPLLIGQGTDDGDIRPSQNVYAAFVRLGIPVVYCIYAREGHVISLKANVIDWWQRRLDFLRKYVLDIH